DPAAVFTIAHSQGITLDSLLIIPHTNGPGVLLDEGASDENPDGGVARTRPGPSQNVTLANLNIIAAKRSAIEVQDGQGIKINNCIIQMTDGAGTWPGIFFSAKDGLIERNEITLTQAQDQGANSPDAGQNVVGGLQIGGGSDGVRVVNNLIQDCNGQ